MRPVRQRRRVEWETIFTPQLMSQLRPIFRPPNPSISVEAPIQQPSPISGSPVIQAIGLYLFGGNGVATASFIEFTRRFPPGNPAGYPAPPREEKHSQTAIAQKAATHGISIPPRTVFP